MWKKVSDEEPPIDCELIISDGSIVTFASRGPSDEKPITGKWYFGYEFEEPWEYERVTHWMPLPAAPNSNNVETHE